MSRMHRVALLLALFAGCSSASPTPGGGPPAATGGASGAAMGAGGMAAGTGGATASSSGQGAASSSSAGGQGGAAKPVAQISLGGRHSCARMTDGSVACWGGNAHGEVGPNAGEMCTGESCSTKPLALAGVSAVDVSAGVTHTCALQSDGTALCWGFNESGGLGDGTTKSHATPGAVVGLSAATKLALGGEHSCALKSDGTATCWGYNYLGQLGTAQFFPCSDLPRNPPYSTKPSPVPGLASVAQIAAGSGHACALTSDGTLSCWGEGTAGQLGAAPGSNCYGSPYSPKPLVVANLSSVAQISAGANQTCARKTDGTVLCWGSNSYGQLGAPSSDMCGNYPCSTKPVALGLSSIVMVATGGMHSCAVKLDGKVLCWGSNLNGQLGVKTPEMCGSFGPCSTTPIAVAGLTSVVAIALGKAHTCALAKDGSVLCWGQNGHGEIGDGSKTDRATPTPVKW